jgi:hypothetical protein
MITNQILRMPSMNQVSFRRQTSIRFNSAEVARLRAMTVDVALKLLGLSSKVDPDYRSYKNSKSKRLIISVDSKVVELIVTGEKWYDVSAKRGGGGAIDLTMYLYGEPFAKAVSRLVSAEVRYGMENE